MSEAFHRDFSERSGNARVRSLRARRKHRKSTNRLSIPAPGWFPVAGAAIGFALILMLVSVAGKPVDARVSADQEEWLAAELPLAVEVGTAPRRTVLKPGDNSQAALQRLGFDPMTVQRIIKAAGKVYPLARVRAGHTFERMDHARNIDVYYHVDATTRLRLWRRADSQTWQASLSQRRITRRQHVASATIEGSLLAAAARAGLDDRTAMNLVDIFSWDIDFARDIRKGDRFRVLYEEQFDENGKSIGSVILAAEFVNQGRHYKAVRYEQQNGRTHYFTPDGKSMRKAYLKAPVKFSRISSRFQARRKHPVLGYTRAHRGVDYAAPSGTPIHAIGDGRIVFAGWKGGYGRFLLIRHTNSSHSTAYAHMRAFARGIKKGKRVHQGRIIGYVGMTGLATGPHLHFEFRLRGRAVNPLTIKRSPARPVARVEMARFRQQTAPLLSHLDNMPADPAWG